MLNLKYTDLREKMEEKFFRGKNFLLISNKKSQEMPDDIKPSQKGIISFHPVLAKPELKAGPPYNAEISREESDGGQDEQQQAE